MPCTGIVVLIDEESNEPLDEGSREDELPELQANSIEEHTIDSNILLIFIVSSYKHLLFPNKE
jgi:hypothetical protein